MKSLNVKTVAIESFDEPQESESGLVKSEATREQEMKKQNRGTVVLIGDDVAWPKEGMVVSYLRNAATDFKDDDGKTYQIVNKAHVLAEFETVKRGK